MNKMDEYYDKWDLEIIEKVNTEIALNLIAEGNIPFEVIARTTGLTIDKVTELATKRAEE